MLGCCSFFSFEPLFWACVSKPSVCLWSWSHFFSATHNRRNQAHPRRRFATNANDQIQESVGILSSHQSILSYDGVQKKEQQREAVMISGSDACKLWLCNDGTSAHTSYTWMYYTRPVRHMILWHDGWLPEAVDVGKTRDRGGSRPRGCCPLESRSKNGHQSPPPANINRAHTQTRHV